jgi:hypothetical protein
MNNNNNKEKMSIKSTKENANTNKEKINVKTNKEKTHYKR